MLSHGECKVMVDASSDLDPETVKKKKVILDIIKLISCHLLEGSKEMD